LEIEIRNPNPPSLTYESKLLEKGEKVEYSYNLDDSFNESWVKVEMSRLPNIDLSRRLDFLGDYEHYCTEQLVSRALPLLYVSDLMDIGDKEKDKLKQNITNAINQLYLRQVYSGGFSYWTGSTSIDDWVTSYAGVFLSLAKGKGYDVNSSVLNKWISYQSNTSKNWKIASSNKRFTYNQSDFLQSFRLYSLALAGSPEKGAMNRLKELKDLSLQARWRLAAAYALSGKQDAANELVFNASKTVSSYSLNNPTYGSSSRDEAMILEALLLMDKTQDAFKQAQKLAANLSEEAYFSTPSVAYSIAAVGQLASKMSGKLDFEWSYNGGKNQKVKESNKAVYQNALSLTQPQGKVVIQNGNEGALYTSIATKSRPIVDNLSPVSENLQLDVKYTDLKGNIIDINQLHQGEDFYAVIKVSNISAANSYNNVALTHIIPSGWEVYNERMLETPDTEGVKNASSLFAYQDIRDDKVLTYFDLPLRSSKEVKIRLQATYLGDFVLPAIQCEAMYDASAHSRTAAGRVEVVK
jgi:uncharacterized protein YfaS (alpha-2-macroglobulin family)